MNYSAQQLAGFEVIEDPNGGNMLVVSVAGSGKTTFLVGGCERIPRTQRVAYCAFNTKIAKEVEKKASHLPHVTAKTFHAFGFGALRKKASRVKLEGKNWKEKKLYILSVGLGLPEDLFEFTRKMVSLAKQNAFGIQRPIQRTDWFDVADHHELWDSLGEEPTMEQIETAVTWCEKLLERSNAVLSDLIDFDDMIYGPLVLNAKADQYDVVMIDEAQDTNAARRLFAKKMLKPGGRLIAVGDPHQAIYGFAGADADALDLIKKEFNCREVPLTVSFRCPAAVVEHARQWVSHIESAPGADPGSVRTITDLEFEKEHVALKAGMAVLCRNTKPLVELAYQLIRKGIGAKVEGKDIGDGLVSLAKRWKVRTLGTLLDKLENYKDTQVQRLLAKGKELQAQSLEDKVQTLQVIINAMPATSTVADLQGRIESLFGNTEPGAPVSTVILSTIHKSKGREWGVVYWLGRNRYQPSKYARQAWQMGQELNLMYVAATRSQGALIEVTVP